MANNYSQMGLTGKSSVKMVTPVSEALMAPVVTMDALQHKTNVINDATKSGKQLGAVVIGLAAGDSHLSIYVARGSKEDAEWEEMNHAAAITPV